MKQCFLALALLLATMGQAQTVAPVDADYTAADSAMARMDYDGAIRGYSKSIESGSPYFLMAYHNRGLCFLELRDYANAESDAIALLSFIPKNKQFDELRGYAHWLYARIYSIRNEKEKALAEYKKAVKYHPISSLYSNVAFVAIGLGKYKEAMPYVNKAIALDKTNAYAYSNRALLYLKKGRLQEADADIAESIRLDPTNPYAFKHRALIYLKEGKTDLACQDLQKAQELGYVNFGDETDANEVYTLQKSNCK